MTRTPLVPGAVFQRDNGVYVRLRAPIANTTDTWSIDIWTSRAWGFFGGTIHAHDLREAVGNPARQNAPIWCKAA